MRSRISTLPAPTDSASTTDAAALPRGCTSLKVRQLSRRVSQHFDRVIAEAGLKTTQFSLLSMALLAGPLRPGDLADRLQMDASTLTRNLQPLLAQGWITLGPGEDGRSRLVTLTDAGRAKQREARGRWKRAQAAFNDRVGPAKVARLHALVDECLAALGEPPADDVLPAAERDAGSRRDQPSPAAGARRR